MRVIRGTNPRKQGLLRLIVPTLPAFDNPDGESRVTTTVGVPIERLVRVTAPAEIVPTVPEPLVKTTVRDPMGPYSDHVSVWVEVPDPEDTVRFVSVGGKSRQHRLE
jgi:hypothetical protein